MASCRVRASILLPIPNNPDPDLVRATRRGDRGAFLELVQRHAPAVRAIVEARMPGSDAIDDETVAAFQRIHKTLVVVRDLTWFHLFAIRTAQTYLDSRRYRHDDPGPAAAPWFAPLTLGQREALFLVERCGPQPRFPPIEYLGIGETAFEARLERGQAIRAKAGEWGDAVLMDQGNIDSIVARVDEALGAAATPKERRNIRRMPLSLAFVLAVAVAGLLAALLFRPR